MKRSINFRHLIFPAGNKSFLTNFIQQRPGIFSLRNSMIIDPYGEVLSEIKSLEDAICIATLNKEKIPLSGGFRYKNARRPELYRNIIGKDHQPSIKPIWMQDKKDGNSEKGPAKI